MNKIKPRTDKCCVPGCRVNDSSCKIQLYSFPARNHNLEKRAKWIKAIKRVNDDGSLWQPSSTSRICSQHFVGGKKSEHPRSPAYLPTIFPEQYYGKQKRTEAAQLRIQNRFVRAMRRSQRVYDSQDKNIQQFVDIGEENNMEENDADIMMQPPPEQRFCESDTQVDFYEDEPTSTYVNMFAVVRINGEICEAGTQTNIAFEKPKKKMVSCKSMAEIGCGPTVEYADKQVGPNPLDIDDSSLLSSKQGFHGFSSIKKEQDLIDFAGVSFSRFKLLMKAAGNCYEGPTSKADLLLIFLIKMKMGLTYSCIGVLFGLHRTTVSRIFHTYLMYLAQSCKNLIQWPSKFVIEQTMPDCFKNEYPNCRALIDCTEFKVEEPPEVSQRVFFYSNYKHAYTAKVLVACSPAGEIIFVSKCFGGRTTDAQITNQSGFLNLVDHGDMIMADKGFPEIKSTLDASQKKVIVVMPPFLKNGTFTADEVRETQKIASLRIHIERIMQRIKTYRITAKIPVSEFEHLDNIIFMTCVLVNLQPPIIKSSSSSFTS